VKDRKVVVDFIQKQLDTQSSRSDIVHRKRRRTHYGMAELRDLLDFLYDGKPAAGEELICEFPDKSA